MMQDLEPFYLRDDETCLDEGEGGEAAVLRGTLRRSNDGCGWQLDGVDLIRYLAQYLGDELVLVIASIRSAPRVENDRYVCSTCGFPLDEMGECLRCQWYGVAKARQRREDLFQEIDRIVEKSWRYSD